MTHRREHHLRFPHPSAGTGRTPRWTAGFSLIEVLVAVTIITVGLFAGITAIGQSQAASTHRQNIDIALAAMQDKIEDFQAYSYVELFVNQINGTTTCRFGTGDTLYFDVPRLNGPYVDKGVAQSSPLKIQKLAENGTALRRVLLRFSVSWTDAMGPTTVEEFFHFTERR